MAKQTCESVYRLNMGFLKRQGYLDSIKQGSLVWMRSDQVVGSVSIVIDPITLSLRFIYSIVASQSIKQAFECIVRLETTNCFFGGKRYWFVCPNVNCQKRTYVLYMRSQNFSCRTCNNLAYVSQQRAHVGYSGAIERCLLTDWDEMERQIRVKRWKGLSTHRYDRFLKRMSRKINNQTISLFEKHLERKQKTTKKFIGK